MNARTALVAMLLFATTLAGCADTGDSEEIQDVDEPAKDLVAFVNGTIPDDFPLPTGVMARDYIESYIMTHPFRLHGGGTQQFMDAARVDLVAELEAMGQNVTLQEYEGGVNILAIQEGTVHPDQWIVLSAHYDTVGAGIGPTVYGAWDDGAGVATLMALAEAFAQWEFPYTIVFAFFDGEEKGLVGSRNFVQAYDPSEQSEIDILANINTDPPGLNWPCGDPSGAFPVKIIHQGQRVQDQEQFARFGWLYNATEYGLDQAGVPMEVRDYSPGIPIATVEGEGVTGSSDHVNFGAVGIANVFLGGVPTTYATGGPQSGGTAALTYPLHTPLDTLEAMEARCVTGSLSGGLEAIVQTFVHALVYMAEHPAPEASIIE